MIAPKLLDYEEAATYISTTPRHLRYLWSRREITAIKVGRAVRFDIHDLDAYIDARRVEAVR